ncbi:zinc ribbon domain-containing protein YjdM [Micavibrio aeruginosavorus]|uniref:zinc ribbon domain-containing protein YjdM n=1 Tax=Micavibrio aeruginosavorus TaxID=349221 RepID=UPI003F4A8918
MTDTQPPCPQCQSAYTYEDRGFYNCPECGHIWSGTANAGGGEGDDKVVRDSNGTVLKDGDTVTVIKDLKVKGSSLVVKVGTKVKNIRLVDGDHDIDCKIPGIGDMGLKSEFVKKVAE